MKERPYFPLLAKVLGWLLLHLVILALTFAAFVGWQLRLGLDSLLSGAAGERLRAFGEVARGEIVMQPRSKWDASLKTLADQKKVAAAIFDYNDPKSFAIRLPANVQQRALTSQPPPPPAGPPARRSPPPGRLGGGPDDPEPLDDQGMPPDGFPEDGPPPGAGRPDRAGGGPAMPQNMPVSRPIFLLKGEGGDGYWAGIQILLPGPFGKPFRQHLLLVRADNLDGSGMFFDFKPWLWGGLAVLALSLAFWTPFVWGITRYLHRLTIATDRIAAGDFKISLPLRGNDELGNLGKAIETMAVRLDHLVSGQKRFLGDAAHELCAPLARVRTGLGILEMKLGESERNNLASIESDAQELATLVEEILAFSRAGSRAPRRESVRIEPLIREVAAREAGDLILEINVPQDLVAVADPSLFSRALGNLIRNAGVHAGPTAKVVISVAESGDYVAVTVADDGPGAPAHELPRLFEPFYRPDRSRSRDTGGSGLGLAIVRTAIEACGGETFASLPPSGGFSVTIRLSKNMPAGQ
ncbi:MAG: HAMP domain-containing sensor histidine kinase [Luteolibacter sp.]